MTDAIGTNDDGQPISYEQAATEMREELPYGWTLTDDGGELTFALTHRRGQRVVIAYDYLEEGWHADLHHPDWPDCNKWLTDADARSEQPGRGPADRKRETVPILEAWKAAYDEMVRVYRQAEGLDD